MRKLGKRLTACFLVAVCVWGFALVSDRRKLNQELIRLHVVANSDSPEDQQIKLQVRDAIQESLLRELGISASILALADASRWKRVLGAMRQFAVSQLKGASMVLVNKIDKVGQEALRETTESVEELAPGIPVHPVCAIQPIPETVWKSLPGMEEL